ncbi:MAG: hypothetical protein JRJ09_18115 [Deltaproteobacteria bacterium]|nr:hypothetical protein [Deltaproteobacteria bacterium]
MLYVIASWCPYYFSFIKDKKERLLIFFAAPGCWKKKVYPLIRVSGLLVEDRGDWMGRLYVLAGKKHRVFDGYIYMVRDLASKAAEACNLTVEYH